MKSLLATCAVLFWTVVVVTPVAAQRDAGSKIRGDAYNVHSSSMYTQHARDHANVLYDFGRTRQAVPQDISAEHIAGVRANMNAAKKELAKLTKAKAADKEVMKHVAAIEAHYAKCEEMCMMCDNASEKGKPDMEMMCDCCATMSQELDAAKAEHDALMKTLGVKKMIEPTKKETK